ncbi:MAG: hypothetical protein V1775_02180 [Bacteroidota bacterium]
MSKDITTNPQGKTMSIDNSHKPNGHTAIVRLEAFADLMEERNARYEEKFKFLEQLFSQALQAAKEQVVSSAAASEKAISKAEKSQDEYNDAHNDLLRRTVPRLEYEADMKSTSEKVDLIRMEIQGLRESRSIASGKEIKGTTNLSYQQWIIGAIVGSTALLISACSLGVVAISFIINYFPK